MSEVFYASKLPPGTRIVIDADYRGLVMIDGFDAYPSQWIAVANPAWKGDTPDLEGHARGGLR